MERITLFDSLLIDDIPDVSMLAPLFSDCNWNHVYMILEKHWDDFMGSLNGNETEAYFKKDVTYFHNMEEAATYFERNADVYLPRQIVSDRDDMIRARLLEIHKRRLEGDVCPGQPFISVCIPSYNRGTQVLRAVETLLSMNYDVEMEIIVSNNGSTQNLDGYRKIQEMKDSRIRYFAFEENQGYATNVRQVLAMARGVWAVLESDEDTVLSESFDEYLNYLLNNQDAGVVFTQGKGPNFAAATPQAYTDKMDTVFMTMNSNYITGITYNMQELNTQNAIARFDANRGNTYLEYYTHCALALFACEDKMAKKAGICLWDAHESVASVRQDSQKLDEIQAYATLESRLEQFRAKVKVLRNMCHLERDIVAEVILEEVQRVYHLQAVVYWYRPKAYEKQYNWLDVCKEIFRESCHVLNENIDIFGEVMEQARDILMNFFFEYGRNEEVLSGMSPQRKQRHLQAMDELECQFKLGTWPDEC